VKEAATEQAEPFYMLAPHCKKNHHVVMMVGDSNEHILLGDDNNGDKQAEPPRVRLPKVVSDQPCYLEDTLGQLKVKLLDEGFHRRRQFQKTVAMSEFELAWSSFIEMRHDDGRSDRLMCALYESVKTYFQPSGITQEAFEQTISRAIHSHPFRKPFATDVWSVLDVTFDGALTRTYAPWAESALYDLVKPYITGHTTRSFCVGVIPLLRNHMWWDVHPECDDMLASLQEFINDLVEECRVCDSLHHYLRAPYFVKAASAVRDKLRFNLSLLGAASSPQPPINHHEWIRLGRVTM
jgi:hypothetical protein